MARWTFVGRRGRTDPVVTIELLVVPVTEDGTRSLDNELESLLGQMEETVDFTMVMFSALLTLWTALPIVDVVLAESLGMASTRVLAVGFRTRVTLVVTRVTAGMIMN